MGPDIGGSIRVEDINDMDELTLSKPILSLCGSVLDDHLCICVKRLLRYGMCCCVKRMLISEE